MACSLCKKEGRNTSRHVLVPYIDRRSGSRRAYLACDHHDSLSLWPVYTRQHPKVNKD